MHLYCFVNILKHIFNVLDGHYLAGIPVTALNYYSVIAQAQLFQQLVVANNVIPDSRLASRSIMRLQPQC